MDQFLPWIKNQLPNKNTTTVIQFSGIAQLEKHYIPVKDLRTVPVIAKLIGFN